jgi:hypothetical protein
MTKSLSFLPSSGNHSSMSVQPSFGSSSRSSKSSTVLGGGAFLVIPHESAVETGLRQLGLSICQDDFMRHQSFLLGNHLYRVFLHDDLLRCGSKGRRNKGCNDISSPSSSSSASSPMRSSLVSLAISVIS